MQCNLHTFCFKIAKTDHFILQQGSKATITRSQPINFYHFSFYRAPKKCLHRHLAVTISHKPNNHIQHTSTVWTHSYVLVLGTIVYRNTPVNKMCIKECQYESSNPDRSPHSGPGWLLHARRRLSANEKEEKVYQGWFLVSLMHNCVQYLPLSLPEKAKD